ncbi:hypothetical protein ACLQ29_00135 [Micromonospora sp. DT228]|uniref:hypothetical protein n=1 Tax=Micromonospora sp. DT228 TaxID=3393443 RepID=UPI003CEDA610
MRVSRKAATLAATAAVAAIAWASPAQAASTATVPGGFQAARGSATASGTLVFRAGWPGSYSVTGTLTVSENDGQCYYVRYYLPTSLLGTGVNSSRQCGPGAVPMQRTLGVQLVNYGVVLALCSTTPGAPEEATFVAPGANCTII